MLARLTGWVALGLAGMTLLMTPALAQAGPGARRAAANSPATGVSRAELGRQITARQAEANRLATERRKVRQLHDARSREAATLKAQGPGVVKALRIGDVLRSVRELADRLNALGERQRLVTAELRKLRLAAVSALDAVLARTAAGPARDRLLAERAQLLAQLGPAQPGRLRVARERIDPLDGPEELTEKANVLRDSEDKIRRQVKLLDGRIRTLAERSRLRDRSRSLDENARFFGEADPRRRILALSSSAGAATSGPSGFRAPAESGGAPAPSAVGGRNVGGAQGDVTTSVPRLPTLTAPRVATRIAVRNGLRPGAGAPARTDDGKDFASPPAPGAVADPNNTAGEAAPPAPSYGGTTGGGSATPAPTGLPAGSMEQAIYQLRDVLNPQLVNELRRSLRSGDPESRLRALRRARADLLRLAGQLQRDASTMQKRAQELKKSGR
jgi:hypothetical protein